MPLNDYTIANFPNNASLSDRLQYWTDIKKNISNHSVSRRLETDKQMVERSLAPKIFSKKNHSKAVLDQLKSLAEAISENSGMENLLPEGFEALYSEEQILDAAQTPIVKESIKQFQTMFEQWKKEDLSIRISIEDLSRANYIMTMDEMAYFLDNYTSQEQREGAEAETEGLEEEGEERWTDEEQWENYSLEKKLRYYAFIKQRFGYGDRQRINQISREAKTIFLDNLKAIGSMLTSLLEMEPRLQSILSKVALHARIDMTRDTKQLAGINQQLAKYSQISQGEFSQRDLPSINTMISALEMLQSWNLRRETKDFEERRYFNLLLGYLNAFTLGDSASPFFADLLHIQQELETLLMLYWIEKFDDWIQKIERMILPEQQWQFNDLATESKNALDSMHRELQHEVFLTWNKTQEEKPVQSDLFERFRTAREEVFKKTQIKNNEIEKARLEREQKENQRLAQRKIDRPKLFKPATPSMPISVIEPEITRVPEPLPLTIETVIREEKQEEEQKTEPVPVSANSNVVSVVEPEVVAVPKPEEKVDAVEEAQVPVEEVQIPVPVNPKDPADLPPEVINNPESAQAPTPVSIPTPAPVSSTPAPSKAPQPCWNFILSIMAHKATKVLAVAVLLLGAIGLICGGLATGGILPLTIIGITTLAAKIFFTGGMGVGMLAGGLTLFANKKARNHLESLGEEPPRLARP